MRVLLVSDLHMKVNWLGWIDQVSSQYDIVVCAGDFLERTLPEDIGHQIRTVSEFITSVARRSIVAVCSGNHDTIDDSADWLEALGDGERIYVDNQVCDLCDYELHLFPWLNRKAKFAGISTGSKQQIWIHHVPPINTLVDWDGKKHRGDSAIAKAVLTHSPLLVLSGHVHVAPFIQDGCWYDRSGSTTILNTGHRNSKYPPHIQIDLRHRSATWFVDCKLGSLTF